MKQRRNRGTGEKMMDNDLGNGGEDEAADTGSGDDALRSDIRFERDRSAALVTLDRPNALNVLNDDMRAQIPDHLEAWASDPDIYCMIIRSACDRAFCAGGDVIELHQQGRAGIGLASLAAEYKLNWLLDRFTKPFISLIDGLVMGSGVGISQYGSHRIAGMNYAFAMPEVAIGFFPDVGATRFLSHMDDEIGTYLGLTGARIGRADAYALGLVTHCISNDDFPQILEAVANADPIDPVVDALHQDPGRGEIASRRDVIGNCFSAPTVEDIISRLEAIDGDHASWRDETLQALGKNSPTSLKVTLRQLRKGQTLDLRRALQFEYHLASKFLQGHDFYEGVRANLIDKDCKPDWQPGQLSQVSDEMVERYFLTDGGRQLELVAPSDADVSNM